jgi:23S rRNA (cytosine1962-C5)-methyltransferase
MKFHVDLLSAQKTGFYLDQLPHYSAVAEHAPERRVLDCFTSQGPFALACARAGAETVIAVEASGESLAAARQNAERNSL